MHKKIPKRNVISSKTNLVLVLWNVIYCKIWERSQSNIRKKHCVSTEVLNSGFVILLVNCSPPVEICYIYCMSKHFFLFSKDRQRRGGRWCGRWQQRSSDGEEEVEEVDKGKQKAKTRAGTKKQLKWHLTYKVWATTYKTWILIDLWCFDATFNNISAISWRPVLVVEDAGLSRENHRPWASNW